MRKMATLDADGKIHVGRLVKIDTSPGPARLSCAGYRSPRIDRTVYTPRNFGYSYISSYHINGQRAP